MTKKHLLLVAALMVGVCSPGFAERGRCLSYFRNFPDHHEWRVFDPVKKTDELFLSKPQIPSLIFWSENDDYVLFLENNKIYRAPWKKGTTPTLVNTVPEDLAKIAMRISQKKGSSEIELVTYEVLEEGDMVKKEGRTYFNYLGKEVDATDEYILGQPSIAAVYQFSPSKPSWSLGRLLPSDDGACDTLGPRVIGKTEGGETLEDRLQFMTYTGQQREYKWIKEAEGDHVLASGVAYLPAASVPSRGFKLVVDETSLRFPLIVMDEDEKNEKVIYDKGADCRRDNPQEPDGPTIGLADSGSLVLMGISSPNSSRPGSIEDFTCLQIFDIRTNQLLHSFSANETSGVWTRTINQ